MKSTIAFLFSLSLLSARLTFAQGELSAVSSGGKLKPLQANMDIRHYTLSLNVDPDRKSIDGFTEIDLLLEKSIDTLLFDLIKKYTITAITVDKINVPFTHNDDYIYITGKKFKPGYHAIRISYSGIPPVAVKPPWDGGFTWDKDKNGKPWIVINDQLNGGKVYFPCKDHPSDEPNEGAELFITVPKGLVVAGPGVLQKISSKGEKSTYHWKTNYTISNYCILFNIGDYKVVSRPYKTVDGTIVPIEFYVLAEDVADAQHVIDIRERDTRILEKYFGEYPWAREKIGIAEVPNPGMEHQTMITYGDRFKYKTIGGLDYSDNLWHEFAHEWWANKVTNKDWAHMWIQEGIATFSESLFFRDTFGESAYDSIMYMVRAGIRNKVPVVQGEGLNMQQAYNGDIYTKGAFFMNTLRYVLGDDVFFPTLKKFITGVKYPYNNFFTTSDVEQFFSRESGKDLAPLFEQYLRTTKTIDFRILRTQPSSYTIYIKNLPMPLPIDILTDKGIVHYTLNPIDPPLKIVSKTQPVIDPKERYFKSVIAD